MSQSSQALSQLPSYGETEGPDEHRTLRVSDLFGVDMPRDMLRYGDFLNPEVYTFQQWVKVLASETPAISDIRIVPHTQLETLLEPGHMDTELEPHILEMFRPYFEDNLLSTAEASPRGRQPRRYRTQKLSNWQTDLDRIFGVTDVEGKGTQYDKVLRVLRGLQARFKAIEAQISSRDGKANSQTGDDPGSREAGPSNAIAATSSGGGSQELNRTRRDERSSPLVPSSSRQPRPSSMQAQGSARLGRFCVLGTIGPNRMPTGDKMWDQVRPRDWGRP